VDPDPSPKVPRVSFDEARIREHQEEAQERKSAVRLVPAKLNSPPRTRSPDGSFSEKEEEKEGKEKEQVSKRLRKRMKGKGKGKQKGQALKGKSKGQPSRQVTMK